MMKHMAWMIAIALVMAGIAPVCASEDVDEKRPLSKDGKVYILNVSGSVNVGSWDKEEVRIVGTLGDDVQQLSVTGDKDALRIKVLWTNGSGRKDIASDLEITLPRTADVSIDVISADVEIEDVEGEVFVKSVSGDVDVEGDAESVAVASVSGDITVEGDCREVDVNTVSGDVDLEGKFGDVEAKSISGDINLEGEYKKVRGRTVSGDIEVEGIKEEVKLKTVSGDLTVVADSCNLVELGSVSGSIEFECAEFKSGRLQAKTQSGTVVLTFPSNISADFDIQTMSGRIVNDFGQKVQRKSEFGPGKELVFEVKGGKVRVRARSFNGSVRLKH